MAENYLETAKQMLYSSQALHKAERWHLSCYLAGYVVESALSAVIEKERIHRNLKKHLGSGVDKGDPLLVINQALIIRTNLIRKYPFLNKSNQSKYPKTIIDGKKNADGKNVEIEAWKTKFRYQPAIWDDKKISEKFQKESLTVYMELTK